MPLTVTCILLIAALITTIMAGREKVPLWVAVLLINIAALLQCMPK